MKRLAWLGAASALVSMASCLWLPDIERHGYTPCDDDGDCAVGRTCEIGLCAPPPWFAPEYKTRQHLVVKNTGDAPFGEGTAYGVRIGEGGVVPTSALGPDGRILRYTPDDDGGSWSDAAIYRDIDFDHLYAWLPLPVGLSPGAEASLGWIYTAHETGDVLLEETPYSVFARFDDFSPEGLVLVELDPLDYLWTGGEPVVQNGVVTLDHNQQLVSRQGLEPPFSLTVRGRINGLLCDSLFIGLVGAEQAGSPPPYAGFFFQAGLEVSADIAPTADSTPAFISPARAIDVPTGLHRYEVRVEPGRVRFLIDGEVFDEKTEFLVRDPFSADAELYPTIDVDGDCTFDLEGYWMTRGPFDTPEVRAEAQVHYREVP